jgi:hypothetical protein
MIYAYTRQQAIENGSQILAADELAQIAEDTGFKLPIYLTRSVFNLIQQAVDHPKYCNDWNGVFHDLMNMAMLATRSNENTDSIKFPCIITGTGHQSRHTFIMCIGPTDIDNPVPALTLMLPGDD